MMSQEQFRAEAIEGLQTVSEPYGVESRNRGANEKSWRKSEFTLESAEWMNENLPTFYPVQKEPDKEKRGTWFLIWESRQWSHLIGERSKGPQSFAVTTWIIRTLPGRNMIDSVKDQYMSTELRIQHTESMWGITHGVIKWCIPHIFIYSRIFSSRDSKEDNHLIC